MTTTPSLPSPVQRAVEELRAQFTGHPLEVTADPGGDIVVIVNHVDVGEQYDPSTTWFGFRISSAYPSADVYPHYLGRVARRDGAAHGQAVQEVQWQGRPALQLSRRAKAWNPRRDNAALKAAKVLAWFADQ